MGAGVARIGNEVRYGGVGDDQPRRECDRGCFVHCSWDVISARKISQSFLIAVLHLSSTDQEPKAASQLWRQLKCLALRAPKARPQCASGLNNLMSDFGSPVVALKSPVLRNNRKVPRRWCN